MANTSLKAKSLFEENRLKIIQNVGYETPDFSHFRSMDIWQSASDSSQYLTSGWIGRYLEDLHPSYPEQYPTSDFPHPLAVELNHSSLLTTGLKSVTSYTSNQPWNHNEISGDFDNIYPVKIKKIDWLDIGHSANYFDTKIKFSLNEK